VSLVLVRPEESRRVGAMALKNFLAQSIQALSIDVSRQRGAIRTAREVALKTKKHVLMALSVVVCNLQARGRSFLGGTMNQTSILDTSRNIILTLIVASLLAGCGGGSGSAIGSLYGMPQPVGTTQPISTPAPGAALATLTLKGAPGFVNAVGLTVYVFDADLASPGHSVCNGACAMNWPHVAPPAGMTLVTPFSQITRDGGNKQLTFGGRPLYTFIADSAVGQTNGDGVNAFGGIWHIARPH
jgi:predicted lipoprotein with Yx(FWY)xxD motif